MKKSAQIEWEQYRKDELAGLTPLLNKYSYELDEEQLHISGERYLLSGKKLVLTGKRTEYGTRVILKASSKQSGKDELSHEHATRHLLDTLPFAYETLLSPKELAYIEEDGYIVGVTAFLSQEKNFLERPLKEQFSLILRSLEAQEGIHATTKGHAKLIGGTFGIRGAKYYVQTFTTTAESIHATDPHNAKLIETLNAAGIFLKGNAETIERYSGFLTHTDFVLHNLRVVDDNIYLLDHTSLQFGNKYESWARITNFMTLYNPALEAALVQYVKDNRSSEEYLSLRLMRAYKLVFLLGFYTGNLAKTAGDLHALTKARIAFWTEALKAVLKDEPLQSNVLNSYVQTRDSLRSEEEKKRQKHLH